MANENENGLNVNTKGGAELPDAGGPAAAPGTDPGQNKSGNDPRFTELRFTEADVDRIIQKRLERERAKVNKTQEDAARAESLAEREHLLEVKERRYSALDAFRDQGFTVIPESALELLNYETEEDYEKSLESVGQLIKDLTDMIEKKRSMGKAPKVYESKAPDPAAEIRAAFGLGK